MFLAPGASAMCGERLAERDRTVVLAKSGPGLRLGLAERRPQMNKDHPNSSGACLLPPQEDSGL